MSAQLPDPAHVATSSPEEEIHIAGAIVHTRQPFTLSACASMSAFSEVEVAQTSPEGRVILVVEAPSARSIVDVLDRIRGIPGVLNIALVYQHAESTAAMNEEIAP